MNGPYRAPLPISEMLDELKRAGRTMPSACIELRNMIRVRAVTLQDYHQPAQSREWLIQGAINWINTRSTWRFNARMTPMRANIVGPPRVATVIRLSIAACHSLGLVLGFRKLRDKLAGIRERDEHFIDLAALENVGHVAFL
jgi:hypothetical protein